MPSKTRKQKVPSIRVAPFLSKIRELSTEELVELRLWIVRIMEEKNRGDKSNISTEKL